MSKWVRKKQLNASNMFVAMTGSPGTAIWVIPAWFVAGLVINNLAAVIGMTGSTVLAALVVAGYVVWWLWQNRGAQRQKIGVIVKEEVAPPGKPGLILPLSTVRPIGGKPEQREALPEALARLAGDASEGPTDDDFDLLEITNLKSPLRAVEFHYDKRHGSERLRDCWLITTEDVTYPDGVTEHGSQKAGRILEKWFFKLHPEAEESVHFHRDAYLGTPLCVRPRDYASLWLTVDAIFENASHKPERMIVDITPGTKPMTLALALACLGPKRTMQYMTAGRHPITGEVLETELPVPILLDDDVYLYELEPAHE